MVALQILKWTVIIITGILLFLILLLLFLLLLPIRYEIQGDLKEKKKNLKGRVNWCCSLFRLSLFYEEIFGLKIRFFGKILYDSLKVDKKELKKEKTKKEKLKKDEVFSGNNKEKPQVNHSKPLGPAEENHEDLKQENFGKEDFSYRKEELRKEKSQSQKKKNNSCEKKESKRRFQRKKASGKLSFFSKIKEKADSLKSKKNKIDGYIAKWKEERVQNAFQKAKYAIGKLCKALLPKKWKLQGEIGFQDPSLTGEFFAGLGILYPYLGKHIDIIPHFEDEVMEVTFAAKGRIRPIYIIFHILLFITNKDVLQLIKEVKKEKKS